MFEDLKEKIEEQNQEKSELAGLSSEVEALLKEQGIDLETMTFEDIYPEGLDHEGNDLSLMSGFELDFWSTFWNIRRYLIEQYPLKEVNPSGQEQIEASDVVMQIDFEKAQNDPKGKVYLQALDKMILLYGKILVLQMNASDFEKICLRHYAFVTYNWIHAKNVGMFRSQLTNVDLFEMVDAYFKICEKYSVPTFEEPYYFLSEKRRLYVKLEGDRLKRTGNYDENEIHISILDVF